MKFIKKGRRPSKENYYMGIARQIAQRSTCLNKRVGAIIVKDDNIISSGYFGAARGMPNCIDIEKCAINELNSNNNKINNKININEYGCIICRGVHAEQNAIINAARSGVSVINGKMYIYGEDKDGNIILGKPCKLCRRAIINSGIDEVIVVGFKEPRRYKVEFWVKESKKDPFIDIEEKV